MVQCLLIVVRLLFKIVFCKEIERIMSMERVKRKSLYTDIMNTFKEEKKFCTETVLYPVQFGTE